MFQVNQLKNEKWAPISLTAEEGITVILSDDKEALTELAGYLAGCRTAGQGAVLVDGQEADGIRVGYMPAGAPIYEGMTLVQWLAFMAELKGMSRSEAKLQADTLLEKYRKTDIQNLNMSRRMKTVDRRMAVLLQTLTGNPSVLVLDQPAAGLDENDTQEMYDQIQRMADEYQVILLMTDPKTAEMMSGQLFLLYEGVLKPVTAEELHSEHIELYQEMVKEKRREDEDLTQILEDYEGGSRDEEPDDTK